MVNSRIHEWLANMTDGWMKSQLYVGLLDEIHDEWMSQWIEDLLGG